MIKGGVYTLFFFIAKNANNKEETKWAQIQNLELKRQLCTLSKSYKTTSYVHKVHSKSIELLGVLKAILATT